MLCCPLNTYVLRCSTMWFSNSVCLGISMLLNYDIFCSFGSRCFSKKHTVGKESPHIHQHCQLICFHRLGKVTPNHGATLPSHNLKKIENLEGCQDPDCLWFISTSRSSICLYPNDNYSSVLQLLLELSFFKLEKWAKYPHLTVP